MKAQSQNPTGECERSLQEREQALQMMITRMSESLSALTEVLSETTNDMFPISREKTHPYWVLVEACLSDMEETTETMARALSLIMQAQLKQAQTPLMS